MPVCTAALALSDYAEADQVSDWGNDAAVYSSQSDLSDWEAPDSSDVESIQDPDALQVQDQAGTELHLFACMSSWRLPQGHALVLHASSVFPLSSI